MKDVPIAKASEGLKEAMRSSHSFKWQEAMEDEMKSMNANDVWDLEEISNGAKIVGCKWVYKAKCDSKLNVERYKNHNGVSGTLRFKVTSDGCKDGIALRGFV